MMIALSKQHALIGITTEERDINNRANVVCMCSRCHSQEEN